MLSKSNKDHCFSTKKKERKHAHTRLQGDIEEADRRH